MGLGTPVGHTVAMGTPTNQDLFEVGESEQVTAAQAQGCGTCTCLGDGSQDSDSNDGESSDGNG